MAGFSAGKNLQNNINTTDPQELSNKTLDNSNEINGAPIQDSTITNASIVSPDKLQMKSYADLATAQADLANRSGGELVYVADIKKTYQVNDDGLGTKTLAEISGGQGGVNYIENSDFEQGVDGYTDDVNFTIAQTKVAGEILRGEASAKLSKAAVDASNEEISVPFTVSRADLAKKLTVSFEYDASDVNYADDDIQVYVKQDPNGTPIVIRINGEDLKGGKGTHYAQFQTDASQTEYELVFKVNSANASAYDVIIDDVKVGPRELAKGTIVTDWKSYNVQVNNIASTNTFYYRRVGEEIQIEGTILATGAASGTITFELPDGLNLDTSKLPGGVTGADSFQVLGEALARDASSGTYFNASALRSLTSTRDIQFNVNGATPVNIGFNPTTPFTWDVGDVINVTMKAPIQGWSSNAVMSEDLGGREIVVRGAGNNNESITANDTEIPFSKIEDTTNSWDGSVFTVPESGYYIFSGAVITTLGSEFNIQTKINGVLGTDSRLLGQNESPGSGYGCFSGVLKLEKGDTVGIIISLSTTLISGNLKDHHIHIQKIPSPQTILETETVAASYSTNQGQMIDFGTNVPVLYETLDFDTHNAYDTSTGEYTVPASGIYVISASVLYNSIHNVGEVVYIDIRVNGTTIKRDFKEANLNDGSNTLRNPSATYIANLNKGDIILITTYQNVFSPSISLNTEPLSNTFSIARIK